MPIYEYLCAGCGEQFEKLVLRPSAAEPIACPKCGETRVEQQLSSFLSPTPGKIKPKAKHAKEFDHFSPDPH